MEPNSLQSWMRAYCRLVRCKCFNEPCRLLQNFLIGILNTIKFASYYGDDGSDTPNCGSDRTLESCITTVNNQ